MMNRQSSFSTATIQSFVTITLILLYANALQCSVSPCHAFSTRSTIFYPLRHSLRQPRRSPHIPKTSYSTSLSLSFQEPDSDDDSAPQSQNNLDPKFQQRSKSWIVLVGLDESVRLEIGHCLRDAGYVVMACTNAWALWEELMMVYVYRFHAQKEIATGTSENHDMSLKFPSVIICNMDLPDDVVDGLTVLSGLKDKKKHPEEYTRIPSILFNATPQDQHEGHPKGPNAYLAKPFVPEELLSTVDNLIQRDEDEI